MTECAARCSTRRWRSSPPPGPVSRWIIAAGITPSRASSSSRGRSSGPVCRYGPRDSPGTANRCTRAARCDGFFPVNLEHPDQLAEAVAAITGLRQHGSAPYDIAIALAPGTDPAPYARAGATWWLAEFPPEAVSLDYVRGVLRDGPAPP